MHGKCGCGRCGTGAGIKAGLNQVKKGSIALIGNQNCGKTTLFNRITGSSQYVGNWPGVTIDKSVGFVASQGLEVADLPGLYSLSPYSPEEMVSRNFLLEGDYDVIVNIVDASHLERSLSLTCELLTFRRPMVIALNMIDLAQKHGLVIDPEALSAQLGVRVVALSAATGEGIEELFAAVAAEIEEVRQTDVCKAYASYLDADLSRTVARIAQILKQHSSTVQVKAEKEAKGSIAAQSFSCRLEGNSSFVALSLLQQDLAYVRAYQDNHEVLAAVHKEILDLEQQCKTDMENRIASLRYAFVDKVVASSVSSVCKVQFDGKDARGESTSAGGSAGTAAANLEKAAAAGINCAAVRQAASWTERIDRVVTNRYLALPIFFGIVYVVYYLAVSTVGTWGTDYANDVIFGEYATNAAAYVLTSFNAPEWLSGLVIDGVIGGVGAVLGFVPQMVVLFVLLSLLEQSGYMTRVAFVLDRIFRHFGLSGLCFIPMVVATGCGVPAIMATNAIDNINEKRITIITATFMPCSAKLPILAMIAAAFFPESTLVAPAIYLMAIVAIGFTALLLKKNSSFKEDVSPFVLEMPDYTMPKLRNIVRSTYERCRSFVIKAGTVIFGTVVAVWFLSSFNFTSEGLALVEVDHSMLAVIGSALAFIFIPLGFASWQASVAVVTGLLAKENVVGTLAVLLGLGEVAEDDATLGAALHGEFSTSAAALSFLAFNLFSTPCIAALGAMKRQLNSHRLFVFAVVYLLSFAYVVSMAIYAIGGVLAGEVPFGANTVIAVVLLLAGLYLVMRPERKGRVSLRIPVRQI